MLSAALTNPIWVIKTRMLSTSAHHSGAYPSMLFGLRAIAREESWRGYFRGLIPSLAGVSHSAVYFVAYEKLKVERAAKLNAAHTINHGVSSSADNAPPRLSNTDYLLISGLSKILAGSLTYPHQVVRARMQNYASHNASDPISTSQRTTGTTTFPHGLLSTMRSIWRQDGLLGFYRGLGPSLLRVVPSTCVTFLVYENVKWALPKRQNGIT